MKHKNKILTLALLSIVVCILFLVIGLNNVNINYALSRRIPKLFAIILTGTSIAFSSMIFQTATNNRILTPSVLGLDSLYMFIQTFIVFVFGSKSLTMSSSNVNFLLCITLMIFFSNILYKMVFKKDGGNVFYLLLVGLIFGTLFKSLSSFMQMVIDPSEFLIVQDKMFASFNNVNTGLLFLSTIIIILCLAYSYDYIRDLDVMSLGREEAINLGVDYDKVVKKMMVVVAILVSVSTALVGPITFLGLLVVNIAREFMQTYKHSYLITASILISIITLVGGQMFVEHVLNFGTTISVIINFVGGLYFMYLLLKEKKL